ncbi:MAG: molybdopterin cofactor-binding domain-containing protein [Gammaproteobacteria bacterium]
MTEEDNTDRLLTRRRVLIGTATVAGGGLALAWFGGDDARVDDDPSTLEPNAWLQLRPDGRIIVQVDKLEMGQGVMTGFATLVAEELGVDPRDITLRHAPVHSLFSDPSQTTGDSQSMRRRWKKLRRVGATAREMLRRAAAERWGIDMDAVETPGGGVLRNTVTGETLAYADVVDAAAQMPVPRVSELKQREQFTVIGQSVPRPDVPDKVTGTTTYGFDMGLPDQLTAVVVRPPSIGARLRRYNTDVESLPGVHDVVRIGAGIAICADTFWHARRAARELDIDWSPSPLGDLNVKRVHAEQRAVLDANDMINARNDGDADAALAVADRVVEAEYALPFLAHATMEPMNATVHVQAERCDVWVPSQSPDMTREVVASLTGLSRAAVHVHVLPAGGGFGRRIMNDFVVEATEIALEVGRPIRLLWSREDDMRHDWFHPASMHRLRAALDDDGELVAWEHRLVLPNTGDQLMPTVLATVLPETLPAGVSAKLADWLLVALDRFIGPVQARDGSRTMPYEIPNVRVAVRGLDSGIPAGIWRSVGNHPNAFAVECFIDELAHAAGADPIEFRQRRLADSPRHLAVLDRLADACGWGAAPEGRYHGVAIHAAYDCVVAQVAEVSVGTGKLRVHRVTCVIDCGVAINPDIVRQQMESGIIFGMSAALYGGIEFDEGRVRQSNFHDYRVVRMAAAPAIEVHILEGADSPGGIGEAGTPPIAPAIANAAFAATGRRIRTLPISV